VAGRQAGVRPAEHAIVCPYLASPGARRKFDVKVGPEVVPRGDPRGSSAAVVGYDGYSWEVSAEGMEILYGQPVELLSYANGADLLAELRVEIARRSFLSSSLSSCVRRRPSWPRRVAGVAVPAGAGPDVAGCLARQAQ